MFKKENTADDRDLQVRQLARHVKHRQHKIF